ncbi:hypothetical protein [Streptomyces sp. NPDC002082]|uniref:hypothetical protein n=1 Tax=Streptomyces sp. NPDC002082 TaxID=3154772 RepID=UPI003331F5AA
MPGRQTADGRRLRASRYPEGFDADRAVTASEALERYARQYRAEIAPALPHPDRCLCHACLTGESA